MGKLDENLTENACKWNLQGQLQLLGASGGRGLDWVSRVVFDPFAECLLLLC